MSKDQVRMFEIGEHSVQVEVDEIRASCLMTNVKGGLIPDVVLVAQVLAT